MAKALKTPIETQRAQQWFALIYRVVAGDLDSNLAIRLMTQKHRIKIDFKAARDWSPEINHPHELN